MITKLYQPNEKTQLGLVNKPGLSGVYVYGWVKKGSKDDPQSLPGLLHLFEHLHIDAISRQHRESIPKLRYSAWTDKEYTLYWVKSSKEHLETALTALSSCFSPISPTGKEVKEGLQHIESEIRQRGKDPWLLLHRQWNKQLFSDSRYAQSTWGSPKRLASLPPEKLVEYGNFSYSTAEKLVLIVGSDLDTIDQHTLDMWKKNFVFDSQKETQAPMSKQREKLREDENNENILSNSTQHSLKYLAWGFKLPEEMYDRRHQIDLLERILAAGWNARLAELYQGKKRVTYSVKSAIHWYKKFGSWEMRAGFRLQDIELVKKRIEFHCKDLATQRISASELKQAKEAILTSLALHSDEPDFIAQWHGGEILHGSNRNVVGFPDYQQKIDLTTAEELEICMEKIFSSGLLYSML